MENPAASSTTQEEAQTPSDTGAGRSTKKRKNKHKKVVGTSYTFGNDATFALGENAHASRTEYHGPFSGEGGKWAGVAVGALVVLGAVVYLRLTQKPHTHIGDVITVGQIGDVNNHNHAMFESPSANINLPSFSLPDVPGWVKRWFTRTPSVV